jgi:hypothetical protein
MAGWEEGAAIGSQAEETRRVEPRAMRFFTAAAIPGPKITGQTTVLGCSELLASAGDLAQKLVCG